MKENLNQRVFELVADVLRCDLAQVSPQTRFIEDLEANSLAVVELSCLVEGEFGVRIGDAKLADIRTVGDLILALQEQITLKSNGTELHKLPASRS